MRREFKKYKSISFKQAWLIVLALHAFAFLGFIQWSNYKAKLAKEFREAKKAQLLAESSSKQDWNNQHIKPKIVAVAPPTPKPKPIKSSESTTPLKAISEVFEETKTAFVSTQNKVAEEIKNAFLNSKKSTTDTFVNKSQTPRAVETPTNKVYITSSKPKQTHSIVKPKAAQQTVNKQMVSNNIISTNEPVTISKTTSKTYFANGLDYRTEEQVVQRLSSHIRL
jgi:hypothetical protein